MRFRKTYSLKKCRHILKVVCKQYRRRHKHLSPHIKREVLSLAEELSTAIEAKDRETATKNAHILQKHFKTHLKKTPVERTLDVVVTLVCALIIAVVVRQTWFELYEIPSGSMRPTLQEKDRLLVSKDQFGINIPLMPNHFFFQEDKVKRGGIVVFTGENLPIHDVNIRYFYLFPGKKQLIKRLIGKPGDTLYFYGGLIYGIDRDGNDISGQFQSPQLKPIDHIPFIHFDGQAITPKAPTKGIYSPVLINQMGEAIAKLYVAPSGRIDGKLIPVFNDTLNTDPLKHYSDYWGIKNYAMVRLLTEDDVKKYTDYPLDTAQRGHMYLELTHNPSLKTAYIGHDRYGRRRPMLGLDYSILPLDKESLKNIWDHISSARLVIHDQFASRYEYNVSHYKRTPYSLQLPGFVNGTYEYENGNYYKIGWEGIRKKIDADAPEYHFDNFAVWLLYNAGMEADKRFLPHSRQSDFMPQRFAYFRDGDLMTMGHVFMKKDNPLLVDFIQREKAKAASAPSYKHYVPFIDHGAPIDEEGTLNKEIIRRFGLVIPDHHYLVLGDNYAMSSDSRDFGFVPENNLRGIPDLIFWPLGKRFGYPLQPAWDLFTTSRLIIWILAAIVIGGSAWIYRRYTLSATIKNLKEKTLK